MVFLFKIVSLKKRDATFCNHSKIYLSLKLKDEQLRQKGHIHKKIIEASKKGDNRARYELYGLYSKAMFNICFRMMNSREEAEDMLQEAFTQAFTKLESFRYESNFGSWLKRIVVNTCINAINKRKVDLTYCEEIYDYDSEEENNDYEPEYTVANITQAMEQLPEGGKMIFSLYLLEGYDHGEIAQILNIKESTSKTQFMRAKRRVVELLRQTHGEAMDKI